MMGWLITLGIICLLGFIPVGLRFLFEKSGSFLWLCLGPVHITLYPGNKKQGEAGQKPKKQAKNKDSAQKKSGGKLTDFLPIAQVVLDFLSDFRRKLWLQNLELKLVLVNDDPCDLAVSYGSAWGILGNVLPLLEQFVKIKNRNLEIGCDYQGEETTVYVRGDLLISLGRFLYISLRHGFRALRKYFKIMNHTKAVQ